MIYTYRGEEIFRIEDGEIRLHPDVTLEKLAKCVIAAMEAHESARRTHQHEREFWRDLNAARNALNDDRRGDRF